ncbi:hypothetical protein ETH_00001635 [Eimeria tenella]|uniref:Uncharacterized protein n=1 Tax=Eimeria tenella TaxID=5802 RepID=U6L3P7_EIMTE|nr:hypothetical protein ETH_00001635 [Eimeria tenella]CDJ43828.1 hypothetical protein ETH_00001635 [Eimeria tenella]|eukprot:XP_013234577.1 hypothetical protein ETH_00001635 [Eimeria tenella]
MAEARHAQLVTNDGLPPFLPSSCPTGVTHTNRSLPQLPEPFRKKVPHPPPFSSMRRRLSSVDPSHQNMSSSSTFNPASNALPPHSPQYALQKIYPLLPPSFALPHHTMLNNPSSLPPRKLALAKALPSQPLRREVPDRHHTLHVHATPNARSSNRFFP